MTDPTATAFLLMTHPHFPTIVDNPTVLQLIERALPECDGVLPYMPVVDEGAGECLTWFLVRGGFAAILLRPNRHATFCRSWIHPSMRGLGLAGALFHARMAQASIMGMEHVGAIVRNQTAVSAFLSRGWRDLEQRSDGKFLVSGILPSVNPGTRRPRDKSLFEMRQPPAPPTLVPASA